MQIGLSLLPSFESAGALLDLSPYVKDHAGLQSSNYLGAVAADKINPSGKVLSVPWVSDVRVLFYRTDILSAAGISSPPSPWTQFHDDALAPLSEDNGVVMELGPCRWRRGDPSCAEDVGAVEQHPTVTDPRH